MQKPLYDALPQIAGGVVALATLRGEIPLASLEGVAPPAFPTHGISGSRREESTIDNFGTATTSCLQSTMQID